VEIKEHRPLASLLQFGALLVLSVRMGGRSSALAVSMAWYTSPIKLAPTQRINLPFPDSDVSDGLLQIQQTELDVRSMSYNLKSHGLLLGIAMYILSI
jgi:hypothetical protein